MYLKKFGFEAYVVRTVVPEKHFRNVFMLALLLFFNLYCRVSVSRYISYQSTFGSRYSRMDQVIFVEDSLSRPYHFKFFKGCLPQTLLGPFLNTLTHLKKYLDQNDV